MLQFIWINDENCAVFLDNRLVINMEHGPHGWDGMVGIRDALLKTAEIAGWKVRVDGDEGI